MYVFFLTVFFNLIRTNLASKLLGKWVESAELLLPRSLFK